LISSLLRLSGKTSDNGRFFPYNNKLIFCKIDSGMNMEQLLTWIQTHGDIRFSRSGGPGGQNVNKVNTKVTLRLAVTRLPLTEEEKARVLKYLHTRLTKEGELVIHSSETRSQKQNRLLAEKRAALLLEKAIEKPRKRPVSRPSRAAAERRLLQKKRRAETKRLRRLII
jgi:ribosome-associated protein